MDWLLHRRHDAEPPRIEQPELQPIRLYSAEAIVTGWVDPAGDRITDILQRRDELAVLPDGTDPRDPEAWRSANPDALILVVPPPHSGRPELRVHRQRQAVRVKAGPYVVAGTAHLKPGHAEDVYLRATQPFLPLTDAAVQRGDELLERADVVIVNMRLVEEFTEI